MRDRPVAADGRPTVRYQILVRGRIGTILGGALEGALVEFEGEDSLLSMEVVDQAHLRGVLAAIGDRGLTILRLDRR